MSYYGYNYFSKPTASYKGIYSCGGWNGGKLAYLLGCSVNFPYGNSNRQHAWTCNNVRKGELPRPVNLGCKKKCISKTSLNYNSEFTQDKIAVFAEFEKLNIPYPKLITVEQIKDNDPSLPAEFLGRKNKSSRGRGITKYSREQWISKEKVPQNDFYVEFLKCKSEHRIHVCLGEVVCELNKIIDPNSKNFIHTAEQGSPLKIGEIVHTEKDKMVDYAIKAVTACGLDFGAVDIFVDTNDKIYILEVNSDPGMPDGIGFLYAQRLRMIFGMEPLLEYNVLADGTPEKPKNKSKYK
jgi:hypothetical protein